MYNKYVETSKAIALRGFFISTSLTSYRPFCQPNTFGARASAVTLHGGYPPRVAFSGLDNRRSNVAVGAFSFLPKANDPGRCANINQGQHKQTEKESTVRRESNTSPEWGQIPSTPESNSDSLTLQLTEAQINIETIQAAIIEQMMALADWMTRFKALQEAADPFREFISGLEMGEL